MLAKRAGSPAPQADPVAATALRALLRRPASRQWKFPKKLLPKVLTGRTSERQTSFRKREPPRKQQERGKQMSIQDLAAKMDAATEGPLVEVANEYQALRQNHDKKDN